MSCFLNLQAKHLRCPKFVWCLLLGCACCALAQTQVDAPGEYKKHLQGIARDSVTGNFFWSFTTVLLKSDQQGRELAKITVPNHYGDLTLQQDRIYVAVNLGRFNQEPGKADSWVYVHDAGSLQLLAKHAVPEVVHGAGGIEWHNHRFYVVGGLPATHTRNYVYEYTADFTFVKRHIIESGQTHLGIQTVCRDHAGNWWFGCYGKPGMILRTNDNFQMLAKHVFNGAVGITCAPDKEKLFVGRNQRVLLPESNLNRGWAILVATSEILDK